MSLVLLMVSIGILALGGLACALAGGRAALANRIGPIAAVVAAIPAAVSGIEHLWTKQDASVQLAWSIPLGSFHVAVDSLTAFFILIIAVICGLSAVYGGAYLKSSAGRKNLGAAWFFYLVLFASMLLVVSARDGMLFLIAWELMSLASFFLVMFDHEHQEVREAGWTYLVATHLGTAFLLVLFVLLAGSSRNLDFDSFAGAGKLVGPGVLFLLAVVGFGTKAGFAPMHVWLPEAHPAAPSHVSAVMSGVMIKTGIYGLLRTLTFLGTPPAWWGWTLIGIGVVTGIGGILFALAQRDLKRLLAYSSVENIGIISLGLGLWLLGSATGQRFVAMLGLLGALLHIWNHAIFKSLLFLAAGAVVHATGTRNIESLGGLLKRMPRTGFVFVLGSAAICALPPFNGFVSEFLLYFAGLAGVAQTGRSPAAAGGLVAIGALALIGGLAVACFAKVFGVVFLGEARSDACDKAHEAPALMRIPLYVLAGLCGLLGLLGPLVVWAVHPLANDLTTRATATAPAVGGVNVSDLLLGISLASAGVLALVLVFWLVRRRLLARRPVEQAGTWDCGYVAPTARMQYTGSSFAWPILNMFRHLLRPQVRVDLPSGLFPPRASFESQTDDLVRRCGYAPLFRALGWLADRLRWVQQGRNQVYVLYIALTLLILLLWKLGVTK